MLQNLQLASDEVMLFKIENLRFKSTMWGDGCGDFFLTNKRVVIIVLQKSLFKKTYKIFEERTEKIKIYQGQPQVKMNGGGWGSSTDVEIYFTDGELTLDFASEKKHAKELVFQCNKLLGDPEVSGIQSDDSSKAFALPGSEKIAQTLKGTISTFKEAFAEQKKKSNNCLNCGGIVTGIVGKVAKCPFCGNVMEIK